MRIDLELLERVREVVVKAGNIIQEIASQGFETEYKAGLDPVTTADYAANQYLQTHLLQLLPESGWLSEETRDNEARLGAELVWIVDPIDGTKEFVERVPQYAISVALAQHGQPVLGVVYNPATEECFYGLKGEGAWLNGQRISAVAVAVAVGPAAGPTSTSGRARDRLLLLGSRSEMKRGEFKEFEADFDVEAVGSIAYKLALVAAGRANTTFSLGPKNEWDIAAGVLLVEATGGRATDKAGEVRVFNQKDTLTNGILAATSEDFERVLGLVGGK